MASEPFREGRNVNAPGRFLCRRRTASCATATTRAGSTTRRSSSAPDGEVAPRSHYAELVAQIASMDGARPAPRGRAREPLVPPSRRDLHRLLRRRARHRAHPPVRSDPAHRLRRRVGGRRGRPPPADRAPSTSSSTTSTTGRRSCTTASCRAGSSSSARHFRREVVGIDVPRRPVPARRRQRPDPRRRRALDGARGQPAHAERRLATCSRTGRS